MTTLPRIEDAGDSDPQQLSAKLKEKAQLSLGADGLSSLEDGLLVKSVDDDNVEKDCELVGAIQSVFVCDGADRSVGTVEEDSVDRQEPAEAVVERLQE